ncbi:hypothetical protein CAEBREN_06251 [Caenorhabditis brenneri]|uniref:PAN-3 domain-containing protein n=1 Tax=Caenorhabditis brenneri TaxID=135651 RepID=G0NCJ5_CAEBE|nr:hypothetical protein CAEBREN_06251 [Caenorhabditis brenneri]
MIVTNGSPQTYIGYSDLALNWEDCLDYCIKNETCMVVYNKDDGCQMFEIGNLQAVKRDPDTRIAFKVVNKNGTCPASDMEPAKGYMFGVNETSERQIYIGYDINYDPITESWKLNSTGVNMCISPRTKMFMRDAGPWCIVMVTNSFCSNHTAMAASCRGLRGQGGELSGFETPEEFEFMKERVNISGWLNVTNNRNSALWMDGVRKPECVGNPSCQGLSAFKLSDPYLSANPTGFMFNPGQPNGTSEDCLGFVVNPDKTVGIVSTLCTLTRPGDNSTCYLGYICGMTPS